jgi:hypothetical protein
LDRARWHELLASEGKFYSQGAKIYAYFHGTFNEFLHQSIPAEAYHRNMLLSSARPHQHPMATSVFPHEPSPFGMIRPSSITLDTNNVKSAVTKGCVYMSHSNRELVACLHCKLFVSRRLYSKFPTSQKIFCKATSVAR